MLRRLVQWLNVVVLAMAQPSFYDAGVSACVPGAGYDHFPFCNASMSVDDRVRDLIARIADEDKANLLTARGFEKSRGRQALPELGVPSYYWGSNCIHSSMSSNCTDGPDSRCSTSFPSGPSWAATFDRMLMQEMAAVVGQETRAFFNLGNFTDNGRNGMGLDCWGPVLNINRDPRWGRHGEGGTEDPLLMGQLGLAWTKGLQGDKRFLQVAVTLKHFDANSLEGGAKADKGYDRHNFSAKISKYLLADYYWPAFRTSIREGKAKGVMCSYNAVNGIPSCLDPLMKAARESWNFTGYVTSDSDAVEDAWKRHGYVKTAAEASCLAIKHGQCDIDSGNTYYHNLLDGVKAGYCSMKDVDGALFNSLRVRFDLGLFDPIEGQAYWKLGQGDIGTDKAKKLNLQAALSSLVLLQNPGILPLKGGQRILMLGPHANSSMDLIQVDTGAVCPDAANEHWNGATGDVKNFQCVQSPFQAIESMNAGKNGSTIYVKGCNLSSSLPGGWELAEAAAKISDVIVLGLGISERPGIASAYLEREAHDRDSIDLPEAQKDLAKKIIALGKPTIIFLLNGGMVAVEDFLNKKNVALIEAFYPGMEGANALALSIFGEANRWGRMPYTVYRSDWTLHNSMLDHDVVHQRTYRYGADAVIPFGFGLSLTHFHLTLASPVKSLTLENQSSSQTLKLVISNQGPFIGDEIIMAYFHPKKVSLPLHPVRSLFDFARVNNIGAGATATIEFTIKAKNILLATSQGDLVIAPGEYMLSFENGSGEVLTVDLQILGQQVVVEPFPNDRLDGTKNEELVI